MYIRLPLANANLALKVAKLEVGWSVCPLRTYQQPEIFRCYTGTEESYVGDAVGLVIKPG